MLQMANNIGLLPKEAAFNGFTEDKLRKVVLETATSFE